MRGMAWWHNCIHQGKISANIGHMVKHADSNTFIKNLFAMMSKSISGHPLYVDPAPWCLENNGATTVDGTEQGNIWHTYNILFHFARTGWETIAEFFFNNMNFPFYTTSKFEEMGIHKVSTILKEQTCDPTFACHVSKSNTNYTLFISCVKNSIL